MSAANLDRVHGTGAHLGSAFDVGFYGIVQKDLGSVLGDKNGSYRATFQQADEIQGHRP